jgi:hypothetical protein
VTKLDAAVPSRRSLPREALVLAVAMAVAKATNCLAVRAPVAVAAP